MASDRAGSGRAAVIVDLLNRLASANAEVVVSAPGTGDGFWAGAPSTVVDNGYVWMAYRLRRPVERGRGYANVLARSPDGLQFETVATLPCELFGCASLERPALVRRPDGGWRLYVSCSTPHSKHWRVEAIDADIPEALPSGRRVVVLPGNEREAWKDVVVKVDQAGWWMWACRHPLDGGDDAADRMTTWFARSSDGLAWTMVAEALTPVAGTWDARGTRVTEVLRSGGRWWAIYDGRRSAEENWRERSGLAAGDRPEHLTAIAGPVPNRIGAALRYASMISLSGGGRRIYFEASRIDGSHDLRTVYVPATSEQSRSE